MKTTQVRPITDLKTHASDLVREVTGNGETILITQNGRPTVVVMDAGKHDRLQETLALLKLLAHSQNSVAHGAPFVSSRDVRKRGRAIIERLSKA